MSVNASEHYEVAVIGAGQAGLAIGNFLALQGRRFVILEAEDFGCVSVAHPLGFAGSFHAAPPR